MFMASGVVPKYWRVRVPAISHEARATTFDEASRKSRVYGGGDKCLYGHLLLLLHQSIK